jgi:hypothetical protein
MQCPMPEGGGEEEGNIILNRGSYPDSCCSWMVVYAHMK